MPDIVSTAGPPTVDARVARDRQRLKETGFVLDFIDKSADARSDQIDIMKIVIDNYMVSPFTSRRCAVPRIGSRQFATSGALTQDPHARGRSVLKDPETNQIIDTLAAQGIGLLMPNMDYIQAVPIGFDDQEKARYLGRLLMGILGSPGTYRTNFTTFKNSFMLGTSIQEIGWETRSRLQATKRPVFDDNGFFLGTEPDVAEVVYTDGPLIREVDNFDAYPDPSGTRIQDDMIGFAKKFRITRQQALAMADAGVYSKSQVNRAISLQNSIKERDREEKRFEEIQTEIPDSYGMMTGFEWWGETPFANPDAARNRVITILEGVHVRSHINPFEDGNIPFKEIVLNPIGGRFWGLGVGEIVRFLQDATDQMLMLFSDAVDMTVRNILLVGGGFAGDIGRLQKRLPNDVIHIGNVDSVKPLPFDTNTLAFAAQELLRRKQSMREASGATNPQQAIPTGGRQTATEVSELVRLASQRVELMVGLVERDDYPWIGRTIHSRLRQFLSREREEILAGESFPVTLADVDFDADIRFIGSRQAQSKFQKAASLREAIRVLGETAQTLPAMKTLVVRYLRDGLDIQDADEIADEMIQVIQQQQQQQLQLQQAELAQQQGGGADENLNTTAGEVSREGVALA